MSLRTFHIFFITLCVGMCIVSAVLIGLLAAAEPWAVPGIFGAAVASAGLAVYGRYFMRRYRNVLQGS